MAKQIWKSILGYCVVANIAVLLSGCSHYAVPGGPAEMSIFTGEKIETANSETKTASKTEKTGDIEIIERKPTAKFPANIVMARVQEPGYKSQTSVGYGRGNYSVVTVRDIESDEDLTKLNELGGISQLSFLSRMLLPNQLVSDRELREAAARLMADMVLIYTVDTTFTDVDNATPLTIVTLGLGPTINTRVITTVSGILMDTRTGYIYGTLEETAKAEQVAAILTTQNAFDQLRQKTERQAFEQFVDEFVALWQKVVNQYNK